MDVETCCVCGRLLWSADAAWPAWEDRPHCETCAAQRTTKDGQPLVLKVDAHER